MPIPLRDYQRSCVDSVHAAANRGLQRPLVAMATGLGKSLCAAYVVKERGGRAVVLAHRDELMRQLGKSIEMAELGHLRIGYVKAEEDDVGADIVIASLQTLARPNRLERLLASQRDVFGGKPFETIISDESHHVTSGEDENTFGAVLRGLGAFDPEGPLVVGWTATPERGDKKALGTTWEEIVFEMGILAGIRAGYLCNLRAKQVQLAVDFSRLHVRAGDFRDEEASDLLLEANAPEHAVKAWRQHAFGRRTLVFTPTVALAQAMEVAFRSEGIRSEHVSGAMSPEQRAAVKGRLERGETLVVPNAQLWTEGFDCPSVSCIVMARPTRSRPFAIQMIGRGTRIFPGKEDCMILDLVGSATRMDLVTVASLFDVSPEAAEGGIAEAVAAASVHVAQPAPQGKLVTFDVELFQKRAFAWVAAGSRFLLSLGEEGSLLLEPGTEPDTWDVVKSKREKVGVNRGGYPRYEERRRKLYAGLPLEMAQGCAEDEVRKAGVAILNDKNAGWRKAPASDKQIRTLGRAYRLGMTMGEASDAISAKFAGRR